MDGEMCYVKDEGGDGEMCYVRGEGGMVRCAM